MVEDIGGRPISAFQDPEPSSSPSYPPSRPRPIHPSNPPIGSLPNSRSAAPPASRGRPADRPPEARAPAGDDDGESAAAEPDPVARVYPPLTRQNGRALHGPEHEHHAETLESVRGEPAAAEPGRRQYPPGPSSRPERIYLHYLLLHLDRLSDHALHYLERAVTEEIDHRRAPPS